MKRDKNGFIIGVDDVAIKHIMDLSYESERYIDAWIDYVNRETLEEAIRRFSLDVERGIRREGLHKRLGILESRLAIKR